MKSNRLKLLIFFLSISTIISGQQTTPVLSLFESSPSITTEDLGRALSDFNTYQINRAVLHQILNEQPKTIAIAFPFEGSERVLQLERYQLLAPNFKLRSGSKVNPVEEKYEQGGYYHGYIEGSEASVVALSFFEEDIMGIVNDEQGAINVGILGDLSSRTNLIAIAYRDGALNESHNWSCSAEEGHSESTSGLPEMSGLLNTLCFNSYLECDYALYQEEGSVSNSVNFITGAYNVVAVLYDNEQITTQISEVFVWTSPDGYPTTNSSDALTAFANAMDASGFNGDLAHLISRNPNNLGGRAYIGTLCNTGSKFRTAYSNIYGSYSAFPQYSWTINVMTHEIGHNLDSRHTHRCSWNNNNTQIDDFGNLWSYNNGNTPEGNACFNPNNPILPSQGGTIMSYGHLNAIGMNFNLGFGPQPGDVIRNQVSLCSNCTGGGGPTNDFCDDAIDIGCGDTETGTTALATSIDAPADCDEELDTAPGVWYKFDGTGQIITASLCGSSFDTKIGVFSGPCNDLTCIVGDDDECSLQSEVTFSSQNGVTYYIYVTGYDQYVGDFTLSVSCQNPICDPPADAAVSGVGYSHFALSWTGTPSTTENVRYRQQGTSSWVTLTDFNSLISLNKIPCTTYEWQVQSVCNGIAGDWSSIETVTTTGCNDPYCYAYGNSFANWIEGVAFEDINNNTSNGYGYTNYTNLSADVEKGQTYSITVDSDGNGSTMYWRIWIDFNADEDFSDTGEQVASFIIAGHNPSVRDIDIPSDATSGQTRMRVAMSSAGYPSLCNTSTGKDVEDYGLFIESPASVLEVSPSSVTFPASGGIQNISVSSNISWGASENVSWLSLSGASGNGDGSFIINAVSNTSSTSRSATVTVSGDNMSRTIAVTQEGAVSSGPPWGDPEPTIASGALIGQVQIDGVPASAEDWIGAFDEDGNLAGSSAIITNQGLAYANLVIYGDDINTPIDEGINPGEAFVLKLYDASEGEVLDYPIAGAAYQFTEWANTNGAPMPAYSSPLDIYNFETSSMDMIALEPGWNLVSTDVFPVDSSVVAIMSGLIPGNLIYVTGFDGQANFYDPGLPDILNSLTHWKPGFGYWVQVNQVDTIWLQGPKITPDYFKPMDPNWNLIAYLPETAQAPEDYLSSFITNGQLQYVTGFDGGFQFYDPNGLPFLNDLVELNNSRGYWIQLDDGSTLNGSGVLNRQLSNLPNPTYEFLWGHTDIPAGNIIHLVDEDGNEWVEWSVEEGGLLKPIAIYGNDTKTAYIKEGPEVNTNLYFMWNGVASSTTHTMSGDRMLHELDIRFNVVHEQTLVVFPNPFQQELNIQFELDLKEEAYIAIHDVYGNTIWQSPLFFETEGRQHLNWKPDSKFYGLYFVSLVRNGIPVEKSKVIFTR
jgi:hypothetical protein